MGIELNQLEEKYNIITPNYGEIENDYYEIVMSNFSYKKISKGRLFNIRPFEAQQAGFKLGRELKKLPKAIKNTYVYYFNNENKVLLIEIYGQTENIINREYYFYTDNMIESIYFNSGTKSVRNIALSKIENGLITETINYGRVDSSVSTYIYQGDLLIEIDVQQRTHTQPDNIIPYKVYFEYKDGSLDKIIDKHPNGYEERRYP